MLMVIDIGFMSHRIKNIRITLFMKRVAQRPLKRMEFLHLSKEQSFMTIGHRILNMMIVPMLYVTFII